MKLRKPLKYCIVTQPFGVNYVDFYKKLGLKGHNGIDFKCDENINYSSFDGIINYSGKYSDGGIGIEIISNYEDSKGKFKAIYYHLKSVHNGIIKGQHVLGGQPIGISDNTGKYTTGSHLHWGIKRCDKKGNTLNYNNGYHGAINPTPYLRKGFYDLPADRKYGQAPSSITDMIMTIKYPFLKQQQRNAIAYGDWNYTEVINDSLYPLWVFLTREEAKAGKKPIIRLNI